jgi:hypothetical protein
MLSFTTRSLAVAAPGGGRAGAVTPASPLARGGRRAL